MNGTIAKAKRSLAPSIRSIQTHCIRIGDFFYPDEGLSTGGNGDSNLRFLCSWERPGKRERLVIIAVPVLPTISPSCSVLGSRTNTNDEPDGVRNVAFLKTSVIRDRR